MDKADEEPMAKPNSNVDDERIRDPTYHTTDANYTLPNDDIEHARLEDQAIGLAEMMHNKLIHAPLQSPKSLVDVGCGTGIVTRQLGDAYPAAKVYGVDLSPVPSGPKPPNVEYILGDVGQLLNNDPRLAHGSADFVFSRLLLLGITDWAGYVRDVASLLRPGGWVEMQDLALEWYLHGTYCSGEWEWMQALFAAGEQKGWDLRCGRNIKGYMEQAGLVDVSVQEYRLPMGDWLARERPETRRIGQHAAREYGMLYYHAIPKMLQGMGYTEEKMEELSVMCTKDWAGQEGKEMRFYATVGRKP
ncbi:MAG: hypothetical protein LQ339_003880 [Xanthoria mediterranea]|nr:MAG: hypothetical protein LQ339_003880 [Xanthoria mediterranea]